MHVLITGICGFVGSTIALAMRQLRPDAKISGIDNFCRPGSETNRLHLQKAGVHVGHRDVRCASDIDTLPDCDWIIDAAANPSVMAGIGGGASSRQLMEHNLLGAVNLLEYAKRCKAGFILLSSNRVYNIPALTKIPLKVADVAFVLDNSATSAARAVRAWNRRIVFDCAARLTLRRHEIGLRNASARIWPGVRLSRGCESLRRISRRNAIWRPGAGHLFVLDPRVCTQAANEIPGLRRHRSSSAGRSSSQ